MPVRSGENAVEELARMRAILQATASFVGFADPDGRPLQINEAGLRLCGLAPEASLPASLASLYPRWAAWRVVSEGLAVAARDGVWRGEAAVFGPDGSEVPVAQEFVAHYDDAGGLAGLSVVMWDLTARRRLEARARHRARLLDAVDQAIVAVDEQGRVDDWNPAAQRLYGWTAQEAAGRRLPELLPPDAGELRARVVDGRSWSGESTARDRDGFERPIWAVVTPYTDEQSGWSGAIVAATDVSGLRAARQQAQRRADQHAVVAGLGQQALDTSDLDRLLGHTCTAVADVLDAELCTVLELSADEAYLWLRAGVGWEQGAVGVATVDNTTDTQAGYTLSADKPVVVADFATEGRVTASPLLTEHRVASGVSVPVVLPRGRAYGVLGVHTRRPREFTEDDTAFLRSVANVIGSAVGQQRAAAELAHLAVFDQLTGLPNRTLFADRLVQALARARRESAGLAVLVVQVDVLDLVKAGLGDQAGDELLTHLAGHMARVVRDTDTLGRLSSDEFGVVRVPLSPDAATAATESLEVAHHLRAEVGGSHRIGAGTVHVTASVGIAHSHGQGDDPDELRRNAQAALRRARRGSHPGIELYEQRMRADVSQQLELADALRRATAEDEFFLAYQPQIDLRTGAVAGLEALLRWRTPTEGVLAPGAFLHVAEDSELIVAIGSWVLHRACEQAASLHDATVPVAVNIAPRQLVGAGLVNTVDAALARTGLAADRLQIELTERAMIDDDRALATLADLRARGVSVAVDDFGTGYASLASLKRFPVDVLKIDRSFVSGLGSRQGDHDLVRAVVALARAFSVTTVGEGVETASQLAVLTELGCDVGQGYYWARPMGYHQLRGWLAAAGRPGDRGGEAAG